MSFPFRMLSQPNNTSARSVSPTSECVLPTNAPRSPLAHALSLPLLVLSESELPLENTDVLSNKSPVVLSEATSTRRIHRSATVTMLAWPLAAPQQNTIGSALVVIRTADTPSRQRPDNLPSSLLRSLSSGLVAPITRYCCYYARSSDIIYVSPRRQSCHARDTNQRVLIVVVTPANTCL